MPDRDYPKLPAIQEAQTSKVDSAVLRDMIAQDDLLRVARRDPAAPGGRAVRVGRRDGAHGVHRRPPAVEGVAAAARAARSWRPACSSRARASSSCGGRSRRARRRRAIGIHDGNFVLKADDVGICVKLIDGQFPPYDQVIPRTTSARSSCRVWRFLDALKRVALMSSDKTFGVRLALEKGKVRVESDNPDLGAAKEEIDVAYKGTPVQIGFNARYFIDLLRGDRDARGARRAVGRAGSRPWCGRPTAGTTSASSCRCGCKPIGRRPCASAS